LWRTGKRPNRASRSEVRLLLHTFGRVTVRISPNKIFEFANPLDNDGDGYIRLLLLKTIHNQHIDGREETTGQVRVQAWTLAKNGTRQKRWIFSAMGNDGASSYEDRFFRVTQWGCCDWPRVNWYYSLLSGKRMYVSNSDLLSTSAPQGGPQLARYVAFGYYDHGKPPILQYGGDLKVKQRFLLLSSREYYDAPQVSIRNGGQPAKSLVLSHRLASRFFYGTLMGSGYVSLFRMTLCKLTKLISQKAIHCASKTSNLVVGDRGRDTTHVVPPAQIRTGAR